MTGHDDALRLWLDALDRDACAAGRPPRDAGVCGPTLTPRLLRTLAMHPDARARIDLLTVVRRLPSSPAIQAALVERLRSDADADVRRRAVAIAAREHDADATRAAVVAALADPDADVARMAVTSICEMRAPAELPDAHVEALLDVLARDADTGQEGRIGRLLAARDDPRAVPLLVAAVEHGSHFWHDAGRRPLERAETFAALARLTTDAHRAAVERCLREAVDRDPYAWGKDAAWRGLAVLGWARDALLACYRDAPPATHPPAGRKALAAFDPEQSRARLAAVWVPRLADADAAVRADARVIVRWVRLAGHASQVRALLDAVPVEERAATRALADDLDALT